MSYIIQVFDVESNRFQGATGQAEKFFPDFLLKLSWLFPDFAKSNFYFKLIIKYIAKHLKLNIKLSILFY